MSAYLKKAGRSFWIGAIAAIVMGASPSAVASTGFETDLPMPMCPGTKGGGDGHSPDPLNVFNQHVELADGELYLLRGRVELRRKQPAFSVDIGEHPWLASLKRKGNPHYLIEGTASYWRAYDGSYGELAARARVQFKADADGTIRQVISLQVIPELSSFPRR